MSNDPQATPPAAPEPPEPHEETAGWVNPAEVYQPAAASSVEAMSDSGLYGFVFSLCGLLCFFMFPVGLVVSLIGLRRPPRGLAIAGTALGGVGTLFLLLFGLAYGTAIVAFFSMFIWRTPQFETETTLESAATTLQDKYAETNQPPDQATGDEVIVNYLDAWGNTLLYEPEESGDFVLRSAGEDRTYNTEDDITHREKFGQPPPIAGAGGGGTAN